MSSSVSSGLPTTKNPWTISIPAFFAAATAASVCASVCSFLRRSRIFWLPLSMPNMSVRQLALAIAGKRSMQTESTRPSQPH